MVFAVANTFIFAGQLPNRPQIIILVRSSLKASAFSSVDRPVLGLPHHLVVAFDRTGQGRLQELGLAGVVRINDAHQHAGMLDDILTAQFLVLRYSNTDVPPSRLVQRRSGAEQKRKWIRVVDREYPR